jgi:hypothetical protein
VRALHLRPEQIAPALSEVDLQHRHHLQRAHVLVVVKDLLLVDELCSDCFMTA